MLAYLASKYFSTGRMPWRIGNVHAIASPYGRPGNDGNAAVAAATPDILPRFVQELGLADSLDRPGIKTAQQRRAGAARNHASISRCRLIRRVDTGSGA